MPVNDRPPEFLSVKQYYEQLADKYYPKIEKLPEETQQKALQEIYSICGRILPWQCTINQMKPIANKYAKNNGKKK